MKNITTNNPKTIHKVITGNESYKHIIKNFMKAAKIKYSKKGNVVDMLWITNEFMVINKTIYYYYYKIILILCINNSRVIK